MVTFQHINPATQTKVHTPCKLMHTMIIFAFGLAQMVLPLYSFGGGHRWALRPGNDMRSRLIPNGVQNRVPPMIFLAVKGKIGRPGPPNQT